MKNKKLKPEIKEQVSTQVILKAIEKKAAAPFKKLDSVSKITSQKDYDLVSDNIATLKVLGGEADEQMRTITDPQELALKNTKALFKPFADQVKNQITQGKALMLAFISDQKYKSIKLESDFSSGKIKKATTLMSKQVSLQVSSSSSSVRKVWTAVPIDESLTPREFMIPDETAIRAALKEGKKVKGWEWKQVENIAV